MFCVLYLISQLVLNFKKVKEMISMMIVNVYLRYRNYNVRSRAVLLLL